MANPPSKGAQRFLKRFHEKEQKQNQQANAPGNSVAKNMARPGAQRRQGVVPQTDIDMADQPRNPFENPYPSMELTPLGKHKHRGGKNNSRPDIDVSMDMSAEQPGSIPLPTAVDTNVNAAPAGRQVGSMVPYLAGAGAAPMTGGQNAGPPFPQSSFPNRGVSALSYQQSSSYPPPFGPYFQQSFVPPAPPQIDLTGSQYHSVSPEYFTASRLTAAVAQRPGYNARNGFQHPDARLALTAAAPRPDYNASNVFLPIGPRLTSTSAAQGPDYNVGNVFQHTDPRLPFPAPTPAVKYSGHNANNGFQHARSGFPLPGATAQGPYYDPRNAFQHPGSKLPSTASAFQNPGYHASNGFLRPAPRLPPTAVPQNLRPRSSIPSSSAGSEDPSSIPRGNGRPLVRNSRDQRYTPYKPSSLSSAAPGYSYTPSSRDHYPPSDVTPTPRDKNPTRNEFSSPLSQDPYTTTPSGDNYPIDNDILFATNRIGVDSSAIPENPFSTSRLSSLRGTKNTTNQLTGFEEYFQGNTSFLGPLANHTMEDSQYVDPRDLVAPMASHAQSTAVPGAFQTAPAVPNGVPNDVQQGLAEAPETGEEILPRPKRVKAWNKQQQQQQAITSASVPIASLNGADASVVAPGADPSATRGTLGTSGAVLPPPPVANPPPPFAATRFDPTKPDPIAASWVDAQAHVKKAVVACLAWRKEEGSEDPIRGFLEIPFYHLTDWELAQRYGFPPNGRPALQAPIPFDSPLAPPLADLKEQFPHLTNEEVGDLLIWPRDPRYPNLPAVSMIENVYLETRGRTIDRGGDDDDEFDDDDDMEFDYADDENDEDYVE